METPVEFKHYFADPNSKESLEECKKVARILKNAGCLCVRDPRVTEQDNNNFLDIFEKYFEQPEDVKRKDARPDIHYQIGVTPEGIEEPRCVADVKCQKMIADMKPENKAHVPTHADPKWRFFHRMGEQPPNTKFDQLNEKPVEPKAFPGWVPTLNAWGKKLIDAALTIAEMAAIGFGVPKDTFTKLMKYGPHLLAPTASDLGKYGKVDTILAGFHQDLNFLTVHGKSRYPGLDIWLRDGTKLPVVVPDGCLLAQAGMQFEYLTGGIVQAGYHEVIVNEKTLAAIEKAKATHKSLWRISSTLFSHIASDNTLEPLLGTESERAELKKKYPPILTGDQVNAELNAIKLHKDARTSM